MDHEDYDQMTRVGFMSRPLRSNLVKEKNSRERSLKRVTFEEADEDDDDDDAAAEEQRNEIKFAHTVESYRLKRDKLMNALAEFKLRQQSPPSAKKTEKRPLVLSFDTLSSIQVDPNAIKTKSSPKTMKGLGLHLNIIDPYQKELSLQQISLEENKENVQDPNISPNNTTKRISGNKLADGISDISDKLTGKSKGKNSFAFFEGKEDQVPKVIESVDHDQSIKKRLIKNIQLERYIKDFEEHEAVIKQSQVEKLGGWVEGLANQSSERSNNKSGLAFFRGKDDQAPKFESMESARSIKNNFLKNVSLDRNVNEPEENKVPYEVALNLSQNADKLGDWIHDVAGLHSIPIIRETSSVIGMKNAKSSLLDLMEVPQISSPVKRIKEDIAAKAQMLLDSRFSTEDKDQHHKKKIFENLISKAAERANSQESNTQRGDELNTSRRQAMLEQEQQAVASQIKLNLLKNMTSKLTPLQTPNPSILDPQKDGKTSDRGSAKKPKIFDFQEVFAQANVLKDQLEQERSESVTLRVSTRSNKLDVSSDRLVGLGNIVKAPANPQMSTPQEEKPFFEVSPLKNILTTSNILEALPDVRSELFNSTSPEKAKSVNRLFNLIENLIYKNYTSNLRAFFTQLMVTETLKSEKWIVFARVCNKLEARSQEEVVRENSLRDAFNSIKELSRDLQNLFALAHDYHDKHTKAMYFVALASYALKRIAQKAKIEEYLLRTQKRTLARTFKAMSSFVIHQQNWLEDVRAQLELQRAGFIIQGWQKYCFQRKLKRRSMRLANQQRLKFLFIKLKEVVERKKKTSSYNAIAYTHISFVVLRKYFARLKVDPNQYKKTQINFEKYGDYIPLQICIKNKVSKITQKDTNNAVIARNKSIAISVLRPVI